MRLLGIETSCDETAASVVEDGMRVRSNVIASSCAAFEATGGVIPEAAARRQVECILPTIELALVQAGCTKDEIDAIAVTRGPGLLGSLLVGTTVARTLGSLWECPVIGVHHTLGHLSSTWLEASDDPPDFPVLTLSASGGHTELWYRTKHTRGDLLGRTRDDAAGEAFDKGAALLGLPYPGGPAIGKAALSGDAHAFAFPLPLREDHTLDFSFSGLKTALRYLLRDLGKPPEGRQLADIAASYQEALCRHLTDRIERALAAHHDIDEVHLVGGVSANTRLRETVGSAVGLKRLRFPRHITYCTDNAAMIAAAGEFLVQEGGDDAYATQETVASLPLEEALA